MGAVALRSKIESNLEMTIEMRMEKKLNEAHTVQAATNA
jgi:hypothetical protein